METKCNHCGSTDGHFRTFTNNRSDRTNYYWVCKCGSNYGHAETEEAAFDVWRKHNLETAKTIA